jgi:hypothetical protein
MPLFNPAVPVISTAIPLRIGGAPAAGVGPLASAHDHVHPLTETSGPIQLAVGPWRDGETPRHVAGVITGRQLDVKRLLAAVSTSSTNFSDISSQLNFDLKANTDYLVNWTLYYETAATTTPIRLATNYSGTQNSGNRIGGIGGTSATAMFCGSATGNDAGLSAPAGPGPGVIVPVVLSGLFRTLTAGTLAPRYRSGATSSSVTIQAGSHGLLVEV